MAEQINCPECGEPMKRDRRLLIGGRTPFVCPNRHMAVDDAEPEQNMKGTARLTDSKEGE